MRPSTRAFWLGSLSSALVALMAPGAVAGRFADEVGAVDRRAGERVASVESLLEPVLSGGIALPANPTQALIDSTASLSAELGFAQDPGPAIRLAGLPEDVAGRLALVVQQLQNCHRISTKHFASLRSRLEAIAADGDGLSVEQFSDIRSCADALWAATGGLETSMQTASFDTASAAGQCAPLGRSIDVWPVLRVETNCATNVYRNDYLLQVDVGGSDTYINNVGSNMVDVNFSPAGAAVVGARGIGDAKGCQRAIPGLAAADCIPTAALLLDLAGSDIYGVKQTPDHDTGCTTDLVVRRMVIGGSGFLGVGILRDAAKSSDTYTGKTGALGSGHVFGVGILSDEGGSDTYTAVRNSQGFALVGGVGILHDVAGNDRYDFYIPAPINPAAPNETEGAGGVRDDQGEGECDRIPRFVQGTGNVLPGTVGIFVDDAGNDRYHGVFVGEFSAPLQFPSTRAGSLGFGNNQGVGVFVDRAGTDTYVVDGESAPGNGDPRRGNGVTIGPNNPRTGEGGGAGVFIDR